MHCRKCGTECGMHISIEKQVCEECKCSFLCHYNFDLLNMSTHIVEAICDIDNKMFKNLEETSKLAKTFGIIWLPLGIQPSEVDRFLKYFSINSDIRKYMFMKSNFRDIETQIQLPFQDRSQDNLIYTTKDTAKDRCNKFFMQRLQTNIDVGRLDHLDKSEGKACNECADMISFGEMCILLPRQFLKESVWHPNCFKCVKCKRLLIDYIFCYDNRDSSGPYCLRHFDDRCFPRCTICDELIFDDEYASVLNENFHIDHLRCHKCTKSLKNVRFVLDPANSQSSKIWKCADCLAMPNIDQCFICRSNLTKSQNPIVMSDGFRAHSGCFSCYICHEPLSISDPSSFVKDDSNRVSCTSCQSSKRLVTCQQCKTHIDLDAETKTHVTSGKFVWHKQCLQCALCKTILAGGDEFVVVDISGKISRSCGKIDLENGSTVCKKCFVSKHQDLCEICNKRIDDEGINYRSRLLHRACFKCCNCNSDLDPSRFTTQDNKFYCVNCFSQLFCKTCFFCKLSIIGIDSKSKAVNFETRYWHENCFNCFACHKPLFEIGFLFGDDRLSCVECEMK